MSTLHVGRFTMEANSSLRCCGLAEVGNFRLVVQPTDKAHTNFTYYPPSEERKALIKEFTESLRAYALMNRIGYNYKGLLQYEQPTKKSSGLPGYDESIIQDMIDAGWKVSVQWASSETTRHQVTQFSLILKEFK